MKRYVISVFILIILWSVVWQLLYNYENKFPNKSITSFSRTVFNDLENIEIVKSNKENNLFEVCKNGNKLIQVLALKENNEWKVKLEKKYIEPIKIYVPENSLVYIEDNLVTKNNIVSYEPTDRYSLLKDKKLLPNLECYEINNYIDIPKLKVINNGSECGLATEGRTVNAFFNISSAKQEELNGILLNTAKLYARYITNDAKFSELSNYLYPNTKFYKEVRNFFNDWYAHDGYEFRDVRVLELKQIADNAFYGDVSFNYILKKGRKEFSFPSKYQIYFIKSEDVWKALCIDTK